MFIEEETMNQNSLLLFRTLKKIASEMDSRGILLEGDFSAAEQLRMDLRNFFCYLSVADGMVQKEEIKYVNKLLEYQFDENTFINCIRHNKIADRDFLNKAPLSLEDYH